MGNGTIGKCSPAEFLLVKCEYERIKSKNLTDLELFTHMSEFLVKNTNSGPPVVDQSFCTLKLISINDVYELDMLPSYATCKQMENTSVNGLVLGILAGDFVAPSLLSSLDKGYSMVDCMNQIGIDYVCIGNHEADITLSQLHDRIRQSSFTWINSNMQTLTLPSDIEPLPEYVIIEVKGGGQTRRVALLGLNTEDPTLYRSGAFGGCTIEPVNSKAKALYDQIMMTEKVDMIIPLTHQAMTRDRELASTGLFPLIIGGHDHESYNEVISGCRVVKSDTEARVIAVTSVTWTSAESESPLVSVELKNASQYPPMPSVANAVTEHKRLLEELERSTLCQIPASLKLSSIGMRHKPTTVGTFVCNTVRDALGTDTVLLPAGIIRASRSYENEKVFTYAHLKSELPFDSAVTTLKLPGKVICDMISYSRHFAALDPPEEKGSYLQTDDGVVWNDVTNEVLKIALQPVDPSKLYSMAVNMAMLSGMDDIKPLLEYKASCAADDHNVHKSDESGLPIKQVIVAYFSQMLLYQIIKSVTFQELDLNGDGLISLDELIVTAHKKFSKTTMSSLLIKNLFSVADEDGNGFLSAHEIIRLYISAMSNMNNGVTCHRKVSCMKNVIGSELNDSFNEELVAKEVMQVDSNSDGWLSLEELSEFEKSRIQAFAKKDNMFSTG